MSDNSCMERAIVTIAPFMRTLVSDDYLIYVYNFNNSSTDSSIQIIMDYNLNQSCYFRTFYPFLRSGMQDEQREIP